jgi:hypothetical protein
VVLTGSVMSQPFADVAVTNRGTTSCLLKGYPRIEAWGHAGTQDASHSKRLGIRVRHGIYERTDPGPRRVVLHPDDSAFFSVGTGTAYQGGLHPIVIERLAVTLPDAQTPTTLAVDLVATRPVGRSIPVGITALSATQT